MSTESIKTDERPANQVASGSDPGETKNQVLILAAHYLPGFKAGGPIRSISNLVSALGDEYEFNVITSDRDLGNSLPYPGVPPNRWIRTGSADVMYLPPGSQGLLKMVEHLRSLDENAVLYLNSIFSRLFSMLAICLRRVGLIHPGCIVIAPRGEFSPGALSLKRRRKRLYIALARWLNLYRGVIWHASSELEAANTRRWFGGVGTICVAPVISQDSGFRADQPLKKQFEGSEDTRRLKAAGHLRIVFVSRISPMKNVLNAIRLLHGVSGDVVFDIYGPVEDIEYWGECEKEISRLPGNVQVNYLGEVAHDQVFGIFSNYDLFLLPTLGENYGHVIGEALGAGCPVLISDQTPWRGLQAAGVGWDVPLDDTDRFGTILQQCVAADEGTHAAMRANAIEFARKRAVDTVIIDANRTLFEKAIAETKIGRLQQ